MSKKRLGKIADILSVLAMLWVVISVLQIGLANPMAGPHEYSAWNFVIIICDLFGI